jgi:hypothetical protein
MARELPKKLGRGLCGVEHDENVVLDQAGVVEQRREDLSVTVSHQYLEDGPVRPTGERDLLPESHGRELTEELPFGLSPDYRRCPGRLRERQQRGPRQGTQEVERATEGEPWKSSEEFSHRVRVQETRVPGDPLGDLWRAERRPQDLQHLEIVKFVPFDELHEAVRIELGYHRPVHVSS